MRHGYIVFRTHNISLGFLFGKTEEEKKKKTAGIGLCFDVSMMIKCRFRGRENALSSSENHAAHYLLRLRALCVFPRKLLPGNTFIRFIVNCVWENKIYIYMLSSPYITFYTVLFETKSYTIFFFSYVITVPVI